MFIISGKMKFFSRKITNIFDRSIEIEIEIEIETKPKAKYNKSIYNGKNIFSKNKKYEKIMH